MPDWSAFVKDRLGRLGLDPGREAEIVAELAGHFEELSKDGRGDKPPEQSAMLHALEQVRDWHQLRRDIRRVEIEEGVMNHRTKSIWLPGLVTGALAWLLPVFLQPFGLHPNIVGTAYPPLVIFLPWTLALVPVGALGAFGSRWAGGNSRELILAGIFPVLVTAALWVLAFPISLAVELIRYGGASSSAMLAGFGSSMLGWVVIPGAALLAGALAVLLAGRHRSISSNAQA